MDAQVRQLRRVRWAVRGTLALGISASLAANVLHAHHLLIDQIISGWPPVAVFATIEAIARVPIRKRWLAIIRMAGLGFVAGIAFWVSYWHMASVASVHGENGSKYLLPLSVDGLVLVASISLVELTAQIAAAEATARVAAAGTATASTVAQAPVAAATADAGLGAPIAVPEVALARAAATVPDGDQPWRMPEHVAAIPVAAAATSATAGHDEDGPSRVRHAPNAAARVAVDDRDGVPQPQPQPRAGGPAIDDPGDGEPRDDDVEFADGVDAVDDAARRSARPAVASPPPVSGTVTVGSGDVPPTNATEAVAWWRTRHPDMPVREICDRVGRSERTVRRILDALPPADPHPDTPSAVNGHRPGVNGATVSTLAGPITSG